MTATKTPCAALAELSGFRRIPAGPAAPAETVFNPALAYLRAFLTVLVVAHHAVLAYHPYGPPLNSFVDTSRIWRAFPVIDGAKSQVFALLVGFNDIFFMSLMFFVSGLFVWTSLQRKGPARFLCDRTLRLGLPFAIGAAILAPLAYYPAYLQRAADHSLGTFVRQWLAQPDWPAGPVWFLCVLLVFNWLAAAIYRLAPMPVEIAGRWAVVAYRFPVGFFHALVGISALAYIPLSLRVSPAAWSTLGPFTFQTARILHYAAYFLIGMIAGRFAIDRGLLASGGQLARNWMRWVVYALAAFAIASTVIVIVITAKAGKPGWSALASFMFVLSCAASSFAVAAIFVRFFAARTRMRDSLAENAYGIYLVHYVFVNWLQYALLNVSIPGLAKGVLATVLGLALSWGVIAALRRIPTVARLI